MSSYVKFIPNVKELKEDEQTLDCFAALLVGQLPEAGAGEHLRQPDNLSQWHRGELFSPSQAEHHVGFDQALPGEQLDSM